MSGPARPAPCVVKVGGSLTADAAALRALLADLAEGRQGRVAIVPGGGAFADAVRDVQGRLGLSDRLAHRLALDAMGHMARIFAEIEPRLPILRTVAALREHGGAALWDPCELAAGRPDVPETWDVTSDSLALWLAAAIGAPRCVLVKAARCPAGASPEDLVRLGLVDAAFPDFARRYGRRIVLCGRDGLRPAGGRPEDAAA